MRDPAIPRWLRARALGTAHRAHGAVPRQLQQPHEDEPVGAHVGRLLLHPHDLVGVRVHVHGAGQRAVRERVELLDAHDGRLFVFSTQPLLGQVVEHLAGAKEDALHLVLGGRRRILENALEAAARLEIPKALVDPWS